MQDEPKAADTYMHAYVQTDVCILFVLRVAASGFHTVYSCVSSMPQMLVSRPSHTVDGQNPAPGWITPYQLVSDSVHRRPSQRFFSCACLKIGCETRSEIPIPRTSL